MRASAPGNDGFRQITTSHKQMQSFLEIKLKSIQQNTQTIVGLCREHGIRVLGVTKGFSGDPRIVDAMVAGGVDGLADSRLENVARLRGNDCKHEITLLRIPRLSDVKYVVGLVDYSLNSELDVIRALSCEAYKYNIKHNIIIMIDVGDRREGILPEDVVDTVRYVSSLKGVHIAGIGTNMGCFGGILPTMNNLRLLLEIKSSIESECGIEVEIVSGGGTSSLELVSAGTMPSGINQLRVGEGILLGTDTTRQTVIPQLAQDAFILYSEIVELKEKPSMPYGEAGFDAFGNVPRFTDMGVRKRAIVSLGKQDVNPDGLIPLDERTTILGASSDHMVIDVTDSPTPYRVGDMIAFRLNYQGLLFLSNSMYVTKKYI